MITLLSLCVSLCICVYFCVCPPVCVSPLILEVYEITLLSVCLHPLNFFVFYAVRLVSKENRRLVLPRYSCF
jgi:hypothetical protein